LRLSPLSLELYQTAAEALIADALATPDRVVDPELRDRRRSRGRQPQRHRLAVLLQRHPRRSPPRPRWPRPYRIEVRAYGQQAGPDPARLSIEVPNRAPTVIDVTATAAAPAIYQLEVPLPAGNAQITVGFVNDYYDAATSADRNLWIDYVEVIGPLDGPVIDEHPPRARILTCPGPRRARLPDRRSSTASPVGPGVGRSVPTS
jgi:hypothetical protein